MAIKVENTTSGNPYHDENNGQFTSSNSNSSGSGSLFAYDEKNISEENKKYINAISRYYGVDIEKLEREHGRYTPLGGKNNNFKFRDGTTPNSAKESYVLNYKYWNMMTKEDQEKAKKDYYDNLYKNKPEKRAEFETNEKLTKIVEEHILSNKDEFFDLLYKSGFDSNEFKFTDIVPNPCFFTDIKNQVDLLVYGGDSKGNQIELHIDLKHKTTHMGQKMDDSFSIDLPVRINSKNKYGWKKSDSSFNSKYAMNDFNLISLIDTNLKVDDFLKGYNPNNKLKVQMGLLENASLKEYIMNVVDDGSGALALKSFHNKIRKDADELIDLFYKNENLVKQAGFEVRTPPNDSKVIFKPYGGSRSGLVLTGKRFEKNGNISINISTNVGFLKESGFLVTNENNNNNKEDNINAIFK